MLKQFGIRFIRRQQLEVYPKRNFCSSNRPPKFEGGERNFFQQDKSTPPHTDPRRLLKLGTRIFLIIGVTILCLPLGTAYLIEVDPKRFDEVIYPQLKEALDQQARAQGIKPTEEQFRKFKERARGAYDPYIKVLRFLGITSAKDDGWKKNDVDSLDFGNDYTGDGNNQSNDKYDFGNNVFDDSRSGFNNSSDEKDEKAW
jgi:hypothetical protein